jgi:hypothetical protein
MKSGWFDVVYKDKDSFVSCGCAKRRASLRLIQTPTTIPAETIATITRREEPVAPGPRYHDLMEEKPFEICLPTLFWLAH